MMQSLKVYGFGSFFTGEGQPNDLDLLLLHRSTDAASCQFAVDCKIEIRLAFPNADIVMLSQEEAAGNEFLARSNAVVIGELHAGDLQFQLRALAKQIREIAFRKL
jgi:hypothetical protein